MGPIPQPPRSKKISESKRQRDVYRFYPPFLRGSDLSAVLEASLDDVLPPADHVPQPSKDPALTAYAQLGALRLGASRALISLIDGHYQYILAESTPTLPLRSDQSHAAAEQLWLGNVCIPRKKGVCEQVLQLQDLDGTVHADVVIIKNLAEDERFAVRLFAKNGVRLKFYAGVPLISPDGAIIGAYCVFDDKPRDGLAREDVALLHDMAATVMEHLSTYKLREDHRRGERMVRGLTSFIEGASALQQSNASRSRRWSQNSHSRTSGNFQMPSELALERDAPPKAELHALAVEDGSLDDSSIPLAELPELPPSRRGSDSATLPATQQNEEPKSPLTRGQSSSAQLQNSILPADSKAMFSRAANIIREASELDGVVIFDASIAAVGGRQRRGERNHTGDNIKGLRWTHPSTNIEQEASSSESSSSSLQKDAAQECQILGFSGAEHSSIGKNGTDLEQCCLTENDLRRMLKLYAGGKIINLNESGVVTTSDDSDGSVVHTESSDQTTTKTSPRRARRQDRIKIMMSAIKAVAPGARSVAFLPLWDYERSRWFAGCLFWTTKPERLLSPDLDLIYLKAFGNSIMTELSRLDEIASNRTKTAFVASISHELRSPLHGILGGVEFMQNTLLDSFQSSMLHSITTCGRTLLDTLNHVLDYAKINEFNRKSRSITQVKNTNHVRVSTKALRRGRTRELDSLSSTFDIALVTEEVVEAIFASQSYRNALNNMDDDDFTAGFALPTPTQEHGITDPKLFSSRKFVLIILDMPKQDSWSFNMPAGAWRRILMNLFGNALKYTNSGFIKISLRADKSSPRLTESETHVVLSVTDSGIGISQDFLANRLYSPFSQENSFSSGVGLGLNIVRQIVESIGGKIDLKSEAQSGTHVAVKLALPDAESLPRDFGGATLSRVSERTKGRKICILQPNRTPDPSTSSEGALQFGRILGRTLEEWFGMSVLITSQWEGYVADLVICTEPSFEYLASIRAMRGPSDKAPVTIFLAIDAIEAATLRDDARTISKESVVEVITQPCGPYKLAVVLDRCLDRFSSILENLPVTVSSEYFPEIPPDSNSSVSLETKPISSTTNTSLSILPNGSPPSDQVSPMTNGAFHHQIHVLIVDDNSINRRLLIALMTKHAFTFREASNGLEALHLYISSTSSPTSTPKNSSAPRRFDVILMDLSMPVMDGMTATRKIRAVERERGWNRTPIIALTGLASASARLEAAECGVDHYLTKPVNFGDLIRVIS